jgi:hypothetical protein
MRHLWVGSDILAILIPIVAIVAGALMAMVSTITRSRVRELEVRERIAMIEKGLVPPPELDPSGFERGLERHRRGARINTDRSSVKHRRVGVVLTSVGLGLMVMLYPSFRVGGFLLVLGLGFLVNGLLFERVRPDPPPSL